MAAGCLVDAHAPEVHVFGLTLRLTPTGRYTLGLFFLLGVVVIWVAVSQLMQYVFLHHGYFKPFALTYIGTAMFTFHLMFIGSEHLWKRFRAGRAGTPEKIKTGTSSRLSRLVQRARGPNKKHAISLDDDDQDYNLDDFGLDDDDEEDAELLSDAGATPTGPRPEAERSTSSLSSPVHTPPAAGSLDVDDEHIFDAESGAVLPSAEEGDQPVVKLTSKQTMKLGLQFCILWFFANYTSSAALQYTSVSSSTILSSTSGFFTLLFGAVFGVEKLDAVRIFSVIVCLGGVVLVSMSDSHGEDGTETAFGDLLSIIGAVLYGAYIVLLKVKIGHEDAVDMRLFFGFVGLFNILLLWPGFILLHFTGIEEFELPNATVFGLVMLNGIVGTLLADYLWMLAMFMTSPMIVTLGLSLTIPLALFVDLLLDAVDLTAVYWVGTSMVLMGFVFVNMHVAKSKTETADGTAAPATKSWKHVLTAPLKWLNQKWAAL